MKVYLFVLSVVTISFARFVSSDEIGKNETEDLVQVFPSAVKFGGIRGTQPEKSKQQSQIQQQQEQQQNQQQQQQNEGLAPVPKADDVRKPNTPEMVRAQNVKRTGYRPSGKKRRKGLRTNMSRVKQDPSVNEVKDTEAVTSAEFPGKHIDDATCTAFKTHNKRKRSRMEIAIKEMQEDGGHVKEAGPTDIPQEEEMKVKEEEEKKVEDEKKEKVEEEKKEKTEGNSTVLEAPKKAKLTYRQFVEWRLNKLNRIHGGSENRSEETKLSNEAEGKSEKSVKIGKVEVEDGKVYLSPVVEPKTDETKAEPKMEKVESKMELEKVETKMETDKVTPKTKLEKVEPKMELEKKVEDQNATKMEIPVANVENKE